jgi:hypothetical protein
MVDGTRTYSALSLSHDTSPNTHLCHTYTARMIDVALDHESAARKSQQDRGQEYVKSILGGRIRCVLEDGRTVTGRFSCMDRL